MGKNTGQLATQAEAKAIGGLGTATSGRIVTYDKLSTFGCAQADQVKHDKSECVPYANIKKAASYNVRVEFGMSLAKNTMYGIFLKNTAITLPSSYATIWGYGTSTGTAGALGTTYLNLTVPANRNVNTTDGELVNVSSGDEKLFIHTWTTASTRTTYLGYFAVPLSAATVTLTK